MTSPLGKKVVARKPQAKDPSTVFEHLHGKVWVDGNGKFQTFEDGPPRPVKPPEAWQGPTDDDYHDYLCC